MDIKKYILLLEKQNHRKKEEYIKDILSDQDIPFVIQKFQYFLFRGENIIVDFPLNVTSQPEIIISAHYDTAFTSPGANDDASGVAVLLSLILLLKKSNISFPPVRFIFFDLEEQYPFLLGSKSYVREYGVGQVKRMYSLDSVGAGNLLLLWAQEDKTPEIIKFLHVPEEIQVVMAPSQIDFGPFHTGFQSDHLPFLAKGVLHACCLTMVSHEDIVYGRKVIKNKNLFHLVDSLFNYYMGRKSDLPRFLRHYHNKNDVDRFVSEKTLTSVQDMLYKAVTANFG